MCHDQRSTHGGQHMGVKVLHKSQLVVVWHLSKKIDRILYSVLQISQSSCSSTDISLRYSNSSSEFSQDISLNSCSLSTFSSSLSYSCDVHLAKAECWRAYNISVAYRNAAPGYGPYSSHTLLQGPQSGMWLCHMSVMWPYHVTNHSCINFMMSYFFLRWPALC